MNIYEEFRLSTLLKTGDDKGCGSGFSNFVDPYFEYGSGSAQLKIGGKGWTDGQKFTILIENFLHVSLFS